MDWYAIYTKYKCEKSVVKSLQQKGVDAYLPLTEVIRLYGKRKKKVILPLITSYVFVNIEKVQSAAVLQTINVVDFVRFSGKAVPIPSNEIDTLRKVTGEFSNISVAKVDLEKGNIVAVISGALSGLKGRLIGKAGKNFVVDLKVIGYSLQMTIPEKYLEPIGTYS